VLRALAGVSGLFAALAVVALALAHAEPVTVKPGDGAVVTSAPLSVEITMSQDMARQAGANDIDVFDANGTEVTRVAAVIDNANRRKLSVPLPSTLTPGRYTVRWKTLSADDGDAADGNLSFTFDPNGTANPGRETLSEVETVETPAAAEPLALGGGGGGTSWVLVVAVAVGMFAAGGGTAFLLTQKRG
jgi:methionine-rich copper-binding protein CopC